MQLALAHHRDEHIERLFRNAVDLFDIQQRAFAHCADERTIDKHIGVVSVGEHPRRVEVTNEARRGEFGIAFDKFESEAEFVGNGTQQRALTGARRPLEQNMTICVEGRQHQFDFALTTNDMRTQPVEKCAIDHA